MRVLAGLLLLATACGGDGGGPVLVDGAAGADGASSSDAPSSATGLVVTLTADPALPGMVRSDVVVTRALFRVKTLEVVGDAGSGGTMQADLELDWSAATQPLPVQFPFAPPGLYSQVTLDIDGDVAEPSYEITGMAMVGGAMAPFAIIDTGRLEVDVRNFDVTLPPNGMATLPVRLDLRDALELDFDQLDNVGGVWTLGPTHALIDGFRDDLDEAFKRLGGGGG